MVRLAIKGSETIVQFRLEQDEDNVAVYANDDLIGEFEINQDGKIEFSTSNPIDTDSFAVTDLGYLVTT